MTKILCFTCDGAGEMLGCHAHSYPCPCAESMPCPDCDEGWQIVPADEVLLTDLWRVDPEQLDEVVLELRDIYKPWQIKKELRRLAKFDLQEARKNRGWKDTSFERMFFGYVSSALKYRSAAHVI